MRIGVLSDTHLHAATEGFRRRVEVCFAGVEMILHAGDLTELAVLQAFGDRTVHAVHGNMCGVSARGVLPESRVIRVGGFVIGLCHGAGPYHNVEERLWSSFGEADCIVYGHTHRPVCHRQGPVLFVNPGSFTGTGPYGAAGTYALLEVNDTIRATILEVPRLS